MDVIVKKVKLSDLGIKKKDMNEPLDNILNKLEGEINIKKNKYNVINKESEKIKDELIEEVYEDNIKERKKILKDIYDRFPELRKYKYIIDMNQLEKGDIIKYVHENIEDISDASIISKIIKSKIDDKVVKYITLYNNSEIKKWKIVPQKYYIFKIRSSNKSIDDEYIRRILENTIKKKNNTI